MRGIVVLACLLPFADGLRPMLARTVARPALAVRPVACMNYAGQPLPNYQQQGGNGLGGKIRGSAGLFLSATGLVTTVAASTFALSASGTIAIIAASAAGLFSFKLSKELHSRGCNPNPNPDPDPSPNPNPNPDPNPNPHSNPKLHSNPNPNPHPTQELNSRGVRSRDVAKRVVGTVADTTLRVCFGVASLIVYTVAAAISIIVLALTKLSQAALGIAGLASRLKPRLPPDSPMSRAEADFLEGRALQQASFAPAAAEAPYPPDYDQYQQQQYQQPAEQQYQQQQQGGGSWYQPRSAPAAEEQESSSAMGQRLAVEQMRARAKASAATARAVEKEKASLLQQRQAR